MESLRKSFNKSLPIVIVILLLGTITFSSFVRYHHKPNFDLIFQSYDEKMEVLGKRYKEARFINDSVEENSVILFLHYSFYVETNYYFYPRITCEFYDYSDDDNALLQFIKSNPIDYLFLANQTVALTSDTTVFEEIEYNSDTFLYKINRGAL